ncbi:MAG: hypothetical protein ABIH34_03365 [Nanoarchaeota archaeon]
MSSKNQRQDREGLMLSRSPGELIVIYKTPYSLHSSIYIALMDIYQNGNKKGHRLRAGVQIRAPRIWDVEGADGQDVKEVKIAESPIARDAFELYLYEGESFFLNEFSEGGGSSGQIAVMASHIRRNQLKFLFFADQDYHVNRLERYDARLIKEIKYFEEERRQFIDQISSLERRLEGQQP